jgi:hypothetical protein
MIIGSAPGTKKEKPNRQAIKAKKGHEEGQ